MVLPEINTRVALLMATRNQAATLAAAVDSLLSQHHRSLSLTIIDDGSDDETPEILARYTDSRLTVYRSKGQGLVAALNVAMQKSKPASVYAVVFASSFYAPTFLDVLLQQLLRSPKAAGVFCYHSENGTDCVFKEPQVDANELLVRNYIGPGQLFRAEAFRQSGGLFLSERKGLWESWQRLAEYGEWLLVNQNLVRWQAHPYEQPPPPPVLDPERELYPKLKVRVLRQANDHPDAEWLQLLENAGHVVQVAPSSQCPQLILCGSLGALPGALALATQSYAPILMVMNDDITLDSLKRFPPSIWRVLSIATRTLSIAAALKPLGVVPLVYMNGMTPREINRLLTRIPMLLYRNRTAIVLRSYGAPMAIKRSLQALRTMHGPSAFGELLIWCADRHPETLRWLQEQPYTWFASQQNHYYSELLSLLKQISATFVMGLDAGVIPAYNWYYTLWPLLSDPLTGMVSGHLNGVAGPQNMPFESASVAEFEYYWPQYRPIQEHEKVPMLSDAAYLMRKTVLEQVLDCYPTTLPLLDDTTLSQQVRELGYACWLQKRTAAFNLMQIF